MLYFIPEVGISSVLMGEEGYEMKEQNRFESWKVLFVASLSLLLLGGILSGSGVDIPGIPKVFVGLGAILGFFGSSLFGMTLFSFANPMGRYFQNEWLEHHNYFGVHLPSWWVVMEIWMLRVGGLILTIGSLFGLFFSLYLIISGGLKTI